VVTQGAAELGWIAAGGDPAWAAEVLAEPLGNFVEVTGAAGDMLMMHPHLFHASSPNCTDRVRIAANFCIALNEPMDLRRSHPADYSLVERAIVNALAGA
jgi:hypothetical protein